VRNLLWKQVPQLTSYSRPALWEGFKRKVEEVQEYGRPMDRRVNNGNRFEPPKSDIDILRHSASFKNGGRFDAAWREEYHRLSEYTRGRYGLSWEMPEAMVRLVNRDLVDGVRAANQGAPALKKLVGGIRRKNDLPSMHRWVVDDLREQLNV